MYFHKYTVPGVICTLENQYPDTPIAALQGKGTAAAVLPDTIGADTSAQLKGIVTRDSAIHTYRQYIGQIMIQIIYR